MSFNGPIKYKDSQAFPFDRMPIIWKEILKSLPLRAFNAVARVHANTHLTLNNEIFPNGDILELLEPADKVRFAQHSFKAACHLFRNPSLMERIHVGDLFAIAASHPSMKTHLMNDRNKVWFHSEERIALELPPDPNVIFSYSWLLLTIKPEISNELWNFLLEPSNVDNIEDQTKRANLYKWELKLAVSNYMPNSDQLDILRICMSLHPSFTFAFLTEYFLLEDIAVFSIRDLCDRSEVIASEVVRRIGRGIFPVYNFSNDALVEFCASKYPSVRQYIQQSPDFSFLKKIDVTLTGLIETTNKYLASTFNFISPSKKEEVKEEPKSKPKTSNEDFQLCLEILEHTERQQHHHIRELDFSSNSGARAYGVLETRLLALGRPVCATTVNRSAMIFDLLSTMVESLDPLKVSRMPESQPLSLNEIARLSVPVPSELPSAKRRKIADANDESLPFSEPVAQPPLLSSFSLHSAPVAAGANLPEVTDDDLYNQDPVEPESTDDDLYNVDPTEESSKKRKRDM